MKKYLPIILPILALALVTFLGMRWYRSREVSEVQMPEVASSTPITPMDSDADRDALDRLSQGLGDYQAVSLDTAASTTDAVGEIRYQLSDDKVLFSVNANLATDNNEEYHVFIKTAESEDYTDIGTLTDSKGGLIKSSSLPLESLPLTVEVRLGDQVVLTGTINAPEAVAATEPNLPLDNQTVQE